MEKSPIFIIGCPRSGTTLVRVILDSHPNIACGPETNLIEQLKKHYKQIEQNWKNIEQYGLTKDDYLNQISRLFEIFQQKYMKINKKQRWAEKTPHNIFFVEFIDKLFPNCQFINVIRDGRDVISSYKKRWGAITILKAIKEWNRSIDLTYKYRNKFGDTRYLEVRYEDLVTNPERETKKIMKFLNEPWTTELLEHHKQKHDYYFNITNIEKNPNRHSPSKPIFQSSVDRWKQDLNIIEKAYVKFKLKENLKKLGYE